MEQVTYVRTVVIQWKPYLLPQWGMTIPPGNITWGGDTFVEAFELFQSLVRGMPLDKAGEFLQILFDTEPSTIDIPL